MKATELTCSPPLFVDDGLDSAVKAFVSNNETVHRALEQSMQLSACQSRLPLEVSPISPDASRNHISGISGYLNNPVPNEPAAAVYYQAGVFSFFLFLRSGILGSTWVDFRARSATGWFPIEHLADWFHRRPRASVHQRHGIQPLVSQPTPSHEQTWERMRQCQAANTSSILLHCLVQIVIRYVHSYLLYSVHHHHQQRRIPPCLFFFP